MALNVDTSRRGSPRPWDIVLVRGMMGGVTRASNPFVPMQSYVCFMFYIGEINPQCKGDLSCGKPSSSTTFIRRVQSYSCEWLKHTSENGGTPPTVALVEYCSTFRLKHFLITGLLDTNPSECLSVMPLFFGWFVLYTSAGRGFRSLDRASHIFS